MRPERRFPGWSRLREGIAGRIRLAPRPLAWLWARLPPVAFLLGLAAALLIAVRLAGELVPSPGEPDPPAPEAAGPDPPPAPFAELDEMAGDALRAALERLEPAAGDAGAEDPPPPAVAPGDLADIAAALERRRERLLERERELDLREEALRAREADLARRLDRLERYKAEIAELIETLDREEEERLARLVAVYENMKPKKAAQIFDRLELEVLLRVVTRMRESKLSLILAAMNPDRAREITRALSTAKPRPQLAPDPKAPPPR